MTRLSQPSSGRSLIDHHIHFDFRDVFKYYRDRGVTVHKSRPFMMISIWFVSCSCEARNVIVSVRSGAAVMWFPVCCIWTDEGRPHRLSRQAEMGIAARIAAMPGLGMRGKCVGSEIGIADMGKDAHATSITDTHRVHFPHAGHTGLRSRRRGCRSQRRRRSCGAW
jgi:hypothetical protein